MKEGHERQQGRLWHQALAYAVTGRRLSWLQVQLAPDLPVLTRQLHQELRQDGLVAIAEAQRRGAWPYRVPADLMAGLGFAQFASALQVLQRELGLDALAQSPPRVGRPQPVDAAERRLLDDVPPHHGS